MKAEDITMSNIGKVGTLKITIKISKVIIFRLYLAKIIISLLKLVLGKIADIEFVEKSKEA